MSWDNNFWKIETLDNSDYTVFDLSGELDHLEINNSLDKNKILQKIPKKVNSIFFINVKSRVKSVADIDFFNPEVFRKYF